MQINPAPLREVQRRFEQDRFATTAGVVIDQIGADSAHCSLPLTPQHKNAMGAVMGGATFTLADFAFAVAANWEHPGVVSLNANITYLSAPKGDTLLAAARCIKKGRTTSCYQVDITDNTGVLVATVLTTGYRL